jgi:site-specific DNA recombinase
MPEGRHNAVIYNRVSTQDQIERTDLNSLISHEERCLHYIRAQGWHHFRTYEDPALSASSLNRPQLQRLLLDLREGHIDYVIVYKLDRLSRSVKDFHTLLERFEAAHVNLVSVTQGFDTSTPAGRLLRNILMDFAEFERELISERTKDKMLARAQKGLWNGGNPPYGYAAQGTQLVVRLEEAYVVKRMFELYGSTRSLAQVVDTINVQYRTRQGRRWAKSTVETILSNPIYAGKISFKDQLFDGVHEPIIAYDLFSALGMMKKVRSHPRSTVDHVFTLKGLLTCAICGSTLTPSWVQKKNGLKIFYYRCVATSLYKTRCPLGQFNAERLEQLVEAKLTETVNRQGFLDELIERMNLQAEELAGPLVEEKRAVDRQLREVSDQIDNYIDVLGQRGSAILALVEEKVKRLQADAKLLTKRRDELTLQLDCRPRAIDAQILQNRLKDFTQVMALATPDEKAQILQLVLKDVRVSKDLLTLNIYDFSSRPMPEVRLGNRTEWLPALDALRNFCFCPQTTLEHMLSNMDRLSVA